MVIRKLLIPLTGAANSEPALVTALMAARLWNAHLLAVHVHVDVRDVAPLAGEGLSGAMIEEMMEATEQEGRTRADAMHALFEQYIRQAAVAEAEPAPGATGPTASFATVVGREDEVLAQEARLADLTVMAHPAAEQEVSSLEVLHAVLFSSGRPILLAPQSPPLSLGERICVAWNGTAESASAVAAALPWLERAQLVRILTAEGYQRRGPSAAELANFLLLHGIAAEVATFRPVDRSVGAGLLAAASEFHGDLLVMGAYSHSRLRQLILGGVTRHVLSYADLPVLMSR